MKKETLQQITTELQRIKKKKKKAPTGNYMPGN